jgi:hypothetical protein
VAPKIHRTDYPHPPRDPSLCPSVPPTNDADISG